MGSFQESYSKSKLSLNGFKWLEFYYSWVCLEGRLSIRTNRPKSRSIRTIQNFASVYKDNLKFCLKKIFFGRRPKIFNKSSIALSSVHDKIEKQALLQGKIYILFLPFKLILRLCVPLALVFWSLCDSLAWSLVNSLAIFFYDTLLMSTNFSVSNSIMDFSPGHALLVETENNNRPFLNSFKAKAS